MFSFSTTRFPNPHHQADAKHLHWNLRVKGSIHSKQRSPNHVQPNDQNSDENNKSHLLVIPLASTPKKPTVTYTYIINTLFHFSVHTELTHPFQVDAKDISGNYTNV